MLPHFTDIVWPDAAAYWIGNARVPLCCWQAGLCALRPARTASALFDLLVENGGRAHRAGRGGRAEQPLIDLRGRQVWPMLVDVHTHLDRGHTVVRSPKRPARSAMRWPRRRRIACAGPTRICWRA